MQKEKPIGYILQHTITNKTHKYKQTKQKHTIY